MRRLKLTVLNIIGIDDFSTSRSDVEKSYAGTAEGYNLVLTHDPNIVLAMQNYHFDYLLSGHFHGGQIHWPKPYHLLKMGKLVRMNMIKGLLIDITVDLFILVRDLAKLVSTFESAAAQKLRFMISH